MRSVGPGIPRLPLIALVLFVCAPAAVRLADGESITLDGRLDEPSWSRAVPAGDFVQIDPDNGSAATEKTEVRIAYDADALYFGITCYDSEPDGWIVAGRCNGDGRSCDTSAP